MDLTPYVPPPTDEEREAWGRRASALLTSERLALPFAARKAWLAALPMGDLDALCRAIPPDGLPAEALRARYGAMNEAGLERGARWGWWPSWGERGPDPPPAVLPLSDYAGLTLAHALAAAGAFRSVGEAKRNGWARPAEAGEYRVGARVVVLR